MRPGIIHLIIGFLLVGGGLSGKLVLFGTNSSMLLVAVGAAVGLYGIYQLVKYR